MFVKFGKAYINIDQIAMVQEKDDLLRVLLADGTMVSVDIPTTHPDAERFLRFLRASIVNGEPVDPEDYILRHNPLGPVGDAACGPGKE